MEETDLLYEEEVIRNPFSLKEWWRYLVSKRDSPAKKRLIIYERALRNLPASYKVWKAYLSERIQHLQSQKLPITHPDYQILNLTFERSLITMNKMPRIWVMYLNFLSDQNLLTLTRRTFDRALRSLPVTQHHLIWPCYLDFINQDGVPIQTRLSVHRRCLMFDPTHIATFINFLFESSLWQEAAHTLSRTLNSDYPSPDHTTATTTTKHNLCLQFCDLLARHSTHIHGYDVDPIIRAAIANFTDQVASLWISLADYYLRRGLLDKARDIFEEAMSTVSTVRDFSLLFDAYSYYEEAALAAEMEQQDKDTEDEEEEILGGAEDCRLDTDLSLSKFTKKILHPSFWLNDVQDTDLRLARLEHLIDRRPLLTNSVLLRQNPHNVDQWRKRATLFQHDPARQILTYAEAVRTVDPTQAVGKPHQLWLDWANLYESHGDITNARAIFGKAVQMNYTAVDHLATLWTQWAEMEVRHKNFEAALELMRRASAEPSLEVRRRLTADGNEPVQLKLHKSVRLWSLYADLEESLGTLESSRKVYDQILDMKVATPQILLNYACLLEEHKFFEDAFKVYERGVKMFKYPHVNEIWTTYISKFVQRYGKIKLERARELFDRALEMVPAQYAKPLYLQYAKLEEDFGLAKRAMKVYDQAVKSVPANEKMSLYEIYIARAAKVLGVSATRDIYQLAINSGLPDKDVKLMCMKYADLENSLAEIDRARAIYEYASQFADPRSDTDFWTKWLEFEVRHGNSSTFQEMLRIKRTVFTSYQQSLPINPEYMMQKDQKPNPEGAVDSLQVDGVGEGETATLEKLFVAPASNHLNSSSSRLGFVSAGVESQLGALERIKRQRQG